VRGRGRRIKARDTDEKLRFVIKEETFFRAGGNGLSAIRTFRRDRGDHQNRRETRLTNEETVFPSWSARLRGEYRSGFAPIGDWKPEK